MWFLVLYEGYREYQRGCPENRKQRRRRSVNGVHPGLRHPENTQKRLTTMAATIREDRRVSIILTGEFLT
jgi:hypothetical protein